MQRLTLAVAGALLATVVAGCLDNETMGGPGSSAMDLERRAGAHVASIDAAAELWMAVAVERTETGWPEARFAPEDAASVGDGEAPEWRYLFVGEEGATWIRVDASGAVTEDEGFDEVGLETMGPIGEWRVDSKDVARTLSGEEAFQAMLAAGASVSWLLVGPPDMDEWDEMDDHEEHQSSVHALAHPAARAALKEASDHTMNAHWVAVLVHDAAMILFIVDAVTGDLIEQVDLGRMGGVGPEGGAFSGALTALGPADEHVLEIREMGHPGLFVRLSTPLSAAVASVTVTSPRGEEQLAATGLFGGQAEVEFPIPEPGEWTVTVRLELGAMQSYNVVWCAFGYAEDGEMLGCE